MNKKLVSEIMREMGRKGGKRGGKLRMEAMTPAERTALAKKAAAASAKVRTAKAKAKSTLPHEDGLFAGNVLSPLPGVGIVTPTAKPKAKRVRK